MRGHVLAGTLGLALACALGPQPLGAAVFQILNGDAPGQGLNDASPRAPVGGNPGTTLGQQRLNVFAAAASAWGGVLASEVPIQLLAAFDTLDCDASSAVLGAAGTTYLYADDGGALPRNNTWYPAALTEALVGGDLTAPDPDIVAVFNSALDDDPACLPALNWWYGITTGPPAGFIDFYTTVLHEIGHGLGFATFVDKATGIKLQGLDDIFMVHLQDGSLNKTWPNLTNAERAASAKDDGDLLWVGDRVKTSSGFLVNGRRPDGRVQMYAPTVLAQGSSVSHFDTDVTPNELMEPFLNNDAESILAVASMLDIGWQLEGASGPCVADADTACLLGNRFAVEVAWTTSSTTGDAQVMSFGGQRATSDQSAFFYFFAAANFEMGVKMVDACVPPFNAFWVFISGLTNQAYTVTITDTALGRVRSYSNPLGVYPTTIGATDSLIGFPCI